MFSRRSKLFISLFVISAILGSVGLFAQQEKSWQGIASSIVGEVIIKGSAYEKLQELSDLIGPRVTGTPEFHKAADGAVE